MISLEDQLGYPVSIPSEPKRIVSLVPSQTELLFDLGLSEKIAGVTHYCVHPQPEVRSAKRVGGTKNPNLDIIRSLKPDLIIANKEENNKEDIDMLRKAFPVYTSDVDHLDSAKEMISDVGTMTGTSNLAVKMVAEIEDHWNWLTDKFHGRNQTVQYLIWNDPVMVVGRDTFIGDLLKRLGFVVPASQKRYPELSLEKLKANPPGYLMLSSEPFPFKEEHLRSFTELLPHTNTWLVDGQMFSWYGSRLLKSPEYFFNLLRQP